MRPVVRAASAWNAKCTIAVFTSAFFTRADRTCADCASAVFTGNHCISAVLTIDICTIANFNRALFPNAA